MANIAGYIANLGKSVAYSASDKMKSMTPATAEFTSTNAELFKSVYNNIRDYKVTYKRSKDLFQKSKVYEATDVLKTSLFEDIKSGKLYNKEREDRMSMKMLGMSDSGEDGFDDSMLNFDDFDFSDIGDFESDDFTTGDKIVSATIDSSTRKSAEMISKVTARTGEYIVENQKMNTNILYTQNMQGFGMLNSNLTSINENIGQMINFSNEAIGQHIKTTADYYNESITLMKDQTALLREIAGYLKPSEKKEEKSKDRITYDDIVGAEGMPDLKLYFQRVKKNIESNSGLGMMTSMNNMFGEDGNALATLMASPLKFIPNYIVNSLVPNTIENSMKDLDKSFGNLFGSIIAKLNTMAKDEDNKLASTIGGIFGISTSAKSDIDTSKYEKGKVDWDGKSRKALIEVIPTQLSKIVSLLSGQEETVYDYDKGRFIKASSIKNEYKNKLKAYGKSATSDMREFFDEYSKLLTFNSLDEHKKFQEDMNKFFEKMYDDGRLFNPNNIKEDTHMDYGIDSKSLRAIAALFKNAPRHMQHSINSDILYNKNKQTAEFEALEKSGTSNLMYMFNGSNINEFIKENKLDKKKIESTSLLARGFDKITDGYGKNIFYYLQNMYKELSFIRQYGTMSGSGGTMPHTPNSMKIISSDGSEYVPEGKTINDIIIPRNKQYTDSENKVREEERQRQKFIESERKRLEKNQSLINFSDIDDDKTIENHLSAMVGLEVAKKKEKLEKDKKKTFVDRLLETESLSEKTSIVFDKLNNITSKPMEFIGGVINNVDKRIYEFIYGKQDAKGEVKGFLDLALLQMKNTFSKFNNFLDEKILTPLKEKFDANSMKEVFKNLLGKMGIDVDHLSDTIKSFFFGEKDADGKRKGGIFGETIEATKQVGKDVFGFVKDSFKDTFSPLVNKGKVLFKSKNEKLFKDLDNSDSSVFGEETLIQQRINNLTDRKNVTGKTQEYYNSIDWDSEENKEYYIKNNYIGGIRNIKAEEVELDNIEGKISKLKIALNSTTGTTNREKISNEIKKLEKRRNFLLDNITEFYKNGNTYKDKLMLKKYNNIKKYYSKNISSALGLDSDSDGVNDILDELFESNKDKYISTGFKDFTTEDFMRSARNLSKSTGDDRYESVIDNIANYVDKYYNEDITKKLSVIADDSGKLIDPNNWYRSEGLPTTAEEFYNMMDDNNSLLLKETIEANDIQINIFTQIADDIRELKNLFSSIKGSRPGSPGPRMGLRPELINNPEGRATHAYAQDLATMIANWMYGNMSHFDEGGYIHKPMVATVGQGEVVLSKDNVERLTSIFTDLMDDLKGKKKSLGATATTAFDKLLPMVKNGEIKDLSVMDKIIKENPELNKVLSTMDPTSRSNYERVFAKINNTLIDKQKSSSELDPVQKALFEQTKPFVEKMGEELVSGLGSVKRSLFGTSEKDDKKNFGDMITDVTSNISTYAPKAIGAGVMGGGISLLTGALGGPLLGAAVGAGISLTKQSKSVQKFLFGELDENGERKGGLIGKGTQDIFKKYIPDMGKLGLVGGLVAPLVTPLGPVGGIIAGSALGFAKNNKDVMNTLFGEKGLFRPEDKEKLEKLMPKAAIGAGIGALTGPFGLVGNIILGSSIGVLTTNQEFREAIFGKYNDNTGQFESGLLPSMREYIIDPLKENASEYKDTFFDYLKEQIFKPVTSAIDPIRTEIAYMVKRPFEKLEEMIVEKIDKSFAPLRDAIKDKFVKPLTDKAKWLIGGIFKIAGNIIASPFKAIGTIGDNLRMKQIAQGRATYMTAEERIEARNLLAINNPLKATKFMKKDKTRDMDMMLSTLSKQDPSKINELADMINGAVDSKGYMLAKRKSLGKEIGSELGQYFDYGRTKSITKALSLGDTKKVYGLIENLKMREDIPEEKRQELINSISSKVDSFVKFEGTRHNQTQVREDMYEKLKEMGIKDISEKNLKKYQKYINSELKNTKKTTSVEDIQGPITPEVAYYKESIDLLKSIAESLKTSNEISEENKSVTEELKESITGETSDSSNKSEENKSVINQMTDKAIKTEVDSYGNVIEFKQSSDGELEADMSDASTARAISIANEDREIRNSFMSNFTNKFSGLFGKNKNDDSEDDKDKKGIFGLLSGLFPLLTKLLNPKTIAGIATASMAAPGFLKVLDAYKEGGVEGAISSLPVIVTESVATGLSKVLPSAFKGTITAMESIGSEDDNILTNTKDTMLRQIVTGGALKTAPESLMKLGAKVGLGKKNPLMERVSKELLSYEGVKGAGKLGLKLMSPFTYIKGGVTAAASIPKLGADIATKVGGTVSGLYSKLDNKTGLKAFSNKISDAFVDKTINTLDKLPVLEANITSLLKKITEILNKIFSDSIIKNLLADKIDKLSSEFIPKFISLLEVQLVKQGDKIAGKIAGALGTGGLLNIAFAIGDFISGYNNAKDILSITDEPTLGMKFACGILKSLNGLFIITSLIPEKVYVDIILKASKAIFGGNSDLQKMREEAKQKAKEYKKENNISGNFDVQDYNKAIIEQNKKLNPNDRNGDGKVTALEKVLNFGSNILKPITTIGSNIVKGVKNFGSNLLNGAKNLFGIGKGDSVGKGDSNVPTRMNNFTYYSQADPKWDIGKIGGTTVKYAGCGPTSVAMLLSELTGQQHTPVEVIKEAYDKGHWTKNGAQWSLFKYFGNKYNIPVIDAGMNWKTFDNMASQGIPQAVSGRGGIPYTNGGHIITVLGKDSQGNFIVNDPVSAERSKAYDVNTIKNGWRNSWGFGSPRGIQSASNGVYDSNTVVNTEKAIESASGIDMFFNDLNTATTNVINKKFGFVGMGHGNNIEDINKINPIYFTDFNEEDSNFNKIKSELEKDKDTLKAIKSLKPIKKTKSFINNIRKKIFKGMGMGGSEPTKKFSASEISDQVLTEFTNISEDEFNAWLASKKKKTAPFREGDANIYLNASNKTGLDPRYIMAHAAWESGWGTSRIARDKNNYYGIRAYNHDPYNSATSFNTASDGILAGAEWIKENYTLRGQDTLNKMINDPSGNKHNYAVYDDGSPNTGWVKGISSIMASAPQSGEIVTSLSTSSVVDSYSTNSNTQEETQSGFEGFLNDLLGLGNAIFSKRYGFDNVTGTNSSPVNTDSTGSVIYNSTSGDTSKLVDEWFISTLSANKSSDYGPRKDPITGKLGVVHTGIDYAAAGGTEIKTPIGGTVISSLSSNDGYGNWLKMRDHNNGVHIFAHMREKSSLKAGDKVTPGQTIGKVGSTGRSTGNHLHYEVRTSDDSKTHTNPNTYFSKLSGSTNKSSNNTGQGGPLVKYTGQGGPLVKAVNNLVKASEQTIKTPKLSIARKPISSKETTNNTDSILDNSKLLAVIIDILHKIATNTSSLSDIVELLSKSLNVNIPEESIKEIKSNNTSLTDGSKQIVNIIKSSIKNDNNSGNEYLLKTLEKLALE